MKSKLLLYPDMKSINDSIRNFIEDIKEEGEIIFASGNYYLHEPIVIKDSKKKVNIIGEKDVRLVGGKKLTNFEKVFNCDVRSRFNSDIVDNIYQCDLSKLNISNVSNYVSRGFDREVVPSHSEIFVDEVPFNIAQYPKKGSYLTIKNYIKQVNNEWNEEVGDLEYGFSYEDDMPKLWKQSNDIWTLGYWAWDWANSYEHISLLDNENGIVKTHYPHGCYNIRKGQRFCFINVLEEVTEKGDYYIDRNNNIVYFYPYDDNFEKVEISLINEPLLYIENCENIDVRGITVDVTCGTGIKVYESYNISIDNCTLKNIGNYAIDIIGSRDCRVVNSTIHDCGDGGINVICGNRKTLESGDILISNNHIYNVAKWTRVYQPPINAIGVGTTITHNLIHDCPHSAIIFWGNDMTITHNEIYSVLMETGDAGAIYTGRDYTIRGNVVSNNYIHHLGGTANGGGMGIYNDDCVSGTLMENNFFFEVPRAAFMGGGRDFIVRNNVFINCYPSVQIDGRGTSKAPVWRNMVDNLMKERFYNIRQYNYNVVTKRINPAEYDNDSTVISALDSPYIDRYPELRGIDYFYKNNLPIPPSALIENNVFSSNEKINLSWDSESGEFIIKNNQSVNNDIFVDYKFSDFTIKEQVLNYNKIDFNNIGIIEEKRESNPIKIMSNLSLDKDNKKIICEFKNMSNTGVSGDIILKGGYNHRFSVDIKPLESRQYAISLTTLDNDKSITLDSNIVGLRPSRILI